MSDARPFWQVPFHARRGVLPPCFGRATGAIMNPVNAPEAIDEVGSEDANRRRALARVGLVLRGKWRIDRLLGVGGMAAVYAGQHRNSKRGAIKMLHAELSSDAQTRARFLREGYLANQVGHPGAVNVLDDDVAEDGSVFLVMELLEGQSVAALAESRPNGRLGRGETLWIADQLLEVLVAAHGKGIVHRDLKPENLFVTREGALKVLDFGLARVVDAPGVAKMTKTGVIMGTPAFMPPEQALGEWSRVDARSDLWAVGASLFALLTGRCVHEAPTVNKLLLQAMTAPAPPIRSLLPGLPAGAAEVVDRALAFDPKDRWPDAGAMQRAVRDAVSSLGARGEAPMVPLATRAEPPMVPLAAAVELGSARTVPAATVATRGGLPAGALVGGALVLLVLAGAGFVVLRTTRAASESAAATASAEVPLPAAQVPAVSPAAEPTADVIPTAEPTTTATATASANARPAPASTGAPRPSAPSNKIDPSLKEWK